MFRSDKSVQGVLALVLLIDEKVPGKKADEGIGR